MRKLLGFLSFLVLLAVAADFGAREITERRIASELASAFRVAGSPEVSIGGFPFLTQLAAGELDSIRFDARAVRARGVEAHEVRIEMRRVRFSPSDIAQMARSVRIGGGSGSVKVSEAALAQALERRGVRAVVRIERGRTTLELAGIGRGEAVLAIEGATLVVVSDELGRSISLPLPRLSRSVEYEGVEVSGGQLRLTLTLRAGSLRLPN